MIRNPKLWTLRRDHALMLKQQGIPYEEAFQMAIRAIPEDDPRTTQSATVANDAGLQERRRLRAEKKRQFDREVDEAVQRTGRPRNEVYDQCFLNCANVAHAQMFNEANAPLPPTGNFLLPWPQGRSSEASGTEGVRTILQGARCGYPQTAPAGRHQAR